MSNAVAEARASYQCPVCGNALPYLAALPPFDAPCSECHSYLWCRRRNSTEDVILEATSGRAPELWEIAKVVNAIGRSGTLDHVTLDLSKLDVVNSSFLAATVALSKQLRASGRALSVCGLCPVVREIFERLRLNAMFDIVDNGGIVPG